MDKILIMNSILLGVGLAMDAFTVSLANGLHEPQMPKKRMLGIAGVFAGFQGLMPLIGWVCVRTVVEYFSMFSRCIPWIALLLLSYIGGKMLIDGIRSGKAETPDDQPAEALRGSTLLLQGVATSIDALSVGFTIADHRFPEALCSVVIIAAVTLLICTAGLALGKKAGMKLAGKATILGGILLIGIGLEIFITHLNGL